MKLKFVLVTACVALSGCAASGAVYREQVAKSTPPAPNQARVTVYRTGESSQYSGRDARISLNGKPTIDVAYKGFNIVDVESGSHTLSVDIWDSPGSCALSVMLEANKDFFYEIKPRSANLVSFLLGGVVGAAIESSGKQCGGAFALIPVEKNLALPALLPLKMTE